MGDEPTAGIDVDDVTAWFSAHISDAIAPLDFSLIAGGRSNLTYRVDDAAGHTWVLRRPPLGHVLATAHDMVREHTIISAFAPTPVPVPGVVGLSPDDSVNGAPFYVMDFVEGQVVRDVEAAAELDDAARHHASESLVDVLAEIHATDVDAIGLGDLARHDGYIERQLKRWYGQWDQSRTRDLAAIEEVHAALRSSIPEQGPAAVVHGDYRLDNCLVGADGAVAAVLDWELCTLGDPLADVGLLMVYWAEADDDVIVGDAPTRLPGFMTRDDVLARYAATSGRDLSAIDFYTAFGYWKLACIVEGVMARYRAGVMGTEDDGTADFLEAEVDRLADAARRTAAAA